MDQLSYWNINLSLSEVSGLRPSAWICVGSGFSREDVKESLLRSGAGLIGDVVTTPDALCARILNVSRDRILGPTVRQEVLRMLLENPRLNGYFPESKRLRRQRGFWKKLDRSIQAFRLIAAHPEEEAVLDERLTERYGGAHPVRNEIRELNRLYEAWLQDQGVWDSSRLLRESIDRLRDAWPDHLIRPDRFLYFRDGIVEALETAWMDELGRWTRVERVEPRVSGPGGPWKWERWHSLQDAVEGLAEEIRRDASWARHTVLIPDSPEVRRAVTRSFSEQNIPLADPRDPTRIRWEESVKAALAPLEIVASRYERGQVMSWIRFLSDVMPEVRSGWAREIQERGIRNGLASYSGGRLTDLHTRLNALNLGLSGRRTAAELFQAHRSILISLNPEPWLVEFVDGIWKRLVDEMALIGNGQGRAPLLYWLERLRERVETAKPPVAKLRPAEGVRVYRFQQAPLIPSDGKLWILGLSLEALSGDRAGDYAYSNRDREILAADFQLRTPEGMRTQRTRTLAAWCEIHSESIFMDYDLEWNGGERPSLLPVLRDLAVNVPGGVDLPSGPTDRGAHPRWLRVYQRALDVRGREFRLPALSPDPSLRLKTTHLDAYSRCAFIGGIKGRWRIYDLREPDGDLWPDQKGNLLHRTLEILLGSRSGTNWGRTIESALDEAWRLEKPKGLLRSDRIEKNVKRRLIRVLEVVIRKEDEYHARSGTDVLSLEDRRDELSLPLGIATVVGRPDRVDSHADGIFIIDYKANNSLQPSAAEMLEMGYGLQLPIYALAASHRHGRPAIGAQFVETSLKGPRSRGIFFEKWNGKKTPASVSDVYSTSTSLLKMEPSEAWTRFEEHIRSHVLGYMSGVYDAFPKKSADCKTCQYTVLCGESRRVMQTGGGTD